MLSQLVRGLVNGRPFGAKSAAEYASLSEAIDSLQPGDILWIPPGTYDIYNKRIPASNVKIIGAGPHLVTLRAPNGSNYNGIFLLDQGRSYLHFEGFTIDVNSTNQTDGFNRGFYFATSAASHVTIRNCRFIGGARSNQNHGVVVSGADHSSIVVEHCIFESYLGSPCIGFYRGRHLVAARNVLLSSSRIEVVPEDSTVTVKDVLIHGNVINGTQGISIIVGLTGRPVRNAVVSNNVIDGSTGDGISIEGSEFVTVSGNVCRNGNDNGISIYRARACSVVGNVCDRNRTNGIVLDAARECVVVGNSCWNNGTGGIEPATRGIRVASSDATYPSDNNLIIGNLLGNDAGNSTQTYGISLEGSQCRGNHVAFNKFVGNAIGDVLDNGQQSMVLTAERMGQATVDIGPINAGSVATFTISVPGAAVGDPVYVAAPDTLPAGLIWSAHVTAADTVTVRVYNPTASAVDPPSGTWVARVSR